VSDEPPTTDGVDAFGLSKWLSAASDEELSTSAERSQPKQLQCELSATTSLCSVYA